MLEGQRKKGKNYNFSLVPINAKKYANALQTLTKHRECKELRRHFGQFNKNLFDLELLEVIVFFIFFHIFS